MTRASDRLKEFAPSFFVLRTPLLPLEQFAAWSDGHEAPQASGRPDQLEGALARDRARLRERLATALERPELDAALFVASPSLHGHVQAWRDEPDGKRGRKVERALVAYFSRATSRATPFGLLAGCSVGRFGNPARLELVGSESYTRHSRLDMDYLWTLADALSRDPQLRVTLSYRPNSSLYRTGGRLRYAESQVVDRARTHRLIAVDETPYLLETLERARDGATLDELARALVDDEVGLDEAEEYVGDLIDAQVLVSDLYPEVTGPEPIYALVRRLAGTPATAGAAAALEETRASLAEMDAVGIRVGPAAYQDIARRLETLPAAPDPARLVQVDMIKPAPGAGLPESVAAEMLRAVQLLDALSMYPGPDPLAAFCERFVQRYEDRELPLVEVLDEEDGIGFQPAGGPEAAAAPLLEGLDFPPPPAEPADWTDRDTMLLRLLAEAVRKGVDEIVLDRDAAAPAVPGAPEQALPDAFGVIATIIAPTAEAVDRGEFRLEFGGMVGPSGARLLGRFCHADEELHACVASHLRAEEQLRPDQLFAEIVHQAEGRTGNIICRPVLREHEITFLGRSGAPPERQLPVTDLLVSVRNGAAVLRSARLGREVTPRLTSAHNYSARGLGPYRFLCALQHQQIVGGLSWRWGPLAGAPFLPRVRSGRVVLSRAMWTLTEDELKRLDSADGSGPYRAFQELREERGLPRHVVLADADNELLVDLDNVLCVETLAARLRRRPGAALVELLPGADELCAEGPEGRFVHELVVPFVRSAAEQHADPATTRLPDGRGPAVPAAEPRSGGPSRGARSFPPGSEWLYAKLYAGSSGLDRLLADGVAPLVEAVRSDVDRWFFLRYADPEGHLRVRFCGEPAVLTSAVLPALHRLTRTAIDHGVAWRMQLDTYEPEVERYGGSQGIALSEEVFSADSDATLAILAVATGDDGLAVRWRAALYGTDRLLSDLGFDERAKLALARTVRDGYEREHRADSALRRQLGERFRRERAELAALLGPRPADVIEAEVIDAYARRSERLAPVSAELRGLADAGLLGRTLPELAASYVHMQANRLLRSAHRAQELVLADFLHRLYTEQLERAR